MMLLPGSYIGFDWPRAVPSEYTSEPINVKVLFSLRSLYLAIFGRTDSRGFESNDHPARTAEDPETCELGSNGEVAGKIATIIYYDGGFAITARVTF